MTKNEKILTILILLSLISVTGDYFIRLHVILPEFGELERQEVAKDIARCKKAVEREIRHVEKLATDWAAWDDLYEFAIDGNERFAGSNFQWETLVDTGIHLLYVIDAQHRVVYSGAVNPDSGQMIKLSQLPEDNFPADHPLLRHSADSVSFAGIFITDSGPMMIASHKILNSLGEGPSHGILLLGRFLNDEVIKELGQQTQIDFKVRNHLFTDFFEADIRRVEELSDGKQVAEIVDDMTMTAFGLINDLQGQPSLLISAVLPRHTMERGRTVARFSSLVLLAAVGVAFHIN